jgi:hypothetical protein
MQPNFVIENDIPIPRKSSIYPVAQLNRDQSIFVPFNESNPTKKQICNLKYKIYKEIKNAKTHHQINGASVSYITRIIDGGIRIWRTA